MARGKKILDIKWRKQGMSIDIPVRAFLRTNHDTGKDEFIFSAEYEPAGIDLKDADINKVKAAVEEALSAWYSIEWELFFRMTVEGGEFGHGQRSFKVEFSYEFFVIGKDTQGNTKHMRIPLVEDVAAFDPKNPQKWSGVEPADGMPETSEKRESFGYNRGEFETKSLVKATPENVAAAERFIDSMEKLLEQMHHHFAPDRVEKMLARSVNLLPAPAEKNGAKS